MQRGVGAPGSPGFARREQRALGRGPAAVPEGAAQHEVAGGKRIRLAAGAHRDVVRRPGADPGDLAQARDQLVELEPAVERKPAVRDGARERADRRGARAREPDRRDVRLGERGGLGEEVREARLGRRRQRLAEALAPGGPRAWSRRARSPAARARRARPARSRPRRRGRAGPGAAARAARAPGCVRAGGRSGADRRRDRTGAARARRSPAGRRARAAAARAARSPLSGSGRTASVPADAPTRSVRR